MILDLVDSVIKDVDGLPGILLSLGHGDSVAGNLVLEGASDLAQGAEVMLGMFLDATFGANGFSAGLAVTVNFVTNVLLAAGNPLHGGISCKGVLKRDLLVRGCGFSSLVNTSARWSKVFIAVNAVHSRILVIAEVALDHPVDVSPVGLGRLDQGVDEGVAGKECNSAETREGEGSTALVAAEVGRLGLGSELLGLETAKAEGVQAEKGTGVIEGLLAHRALGQLVDCVER